MAKMDIYGDLRIPFDVATYCRAHKYSVPAVDLARAIREREAALEALEEANRVMDAADEHLQKRISAVKEKMEREGNA